MDCHNDSDFVFSQVSGFVQMAYFTTSKTRKFDINIASPSVSH